MSNTAGSEIQVLGMSTAQETALAALRAGSSFPQAAEQAGVNRIPRRERRAALDGRATPQWMEDLRAAIEAAERKERRQTAEDATKRANPGDGPQAGDGERAQGDESKLRPERELGRSAGAGCAGPADATGRATGDGVSHELGGEAKSQ